MSFVSDDLEFLQEAGLKLNQGRRWRVLKRAGRMLLIVPDGGKEVDTGISLYQPQRSIAKSIVMVLSKLPFTRKFLPSIEMVWVDDGPLAKILKDKQAELCGMLLGNPSQEERRLIILIKTADHSMQVVKMGVGDIARKKVEDEYLLLRSVSERWKTNANIARCTGHWRGDHWSAFSSDYLLGGRSYSMAEVCATLSSWLENEFVAVSDLESWRVMLDRCQSSGLLRMIGEHSKKLKLKPALRHGDFTPWNILECPSGKMVVIDWEFGIFDDVPGWDLVHYLVLEAQLVKRLPHDETVKHVIHLLESDKAVRAYLGECGWANLSHLLFATYLVWMNRDLEGGMEMLQMLDLDDAEILVL